MKLRPTLYFVTQATEDSFGGAVWSLAINHSHTHLAVSIRVLDKSSLIFCSFALKQAQFLFNHVICRYKLLELSTFVWYMCCINSIPNALPSAIDSNYMYYQ